MIGRATVERELATLERRYAQHAKTMARTAQLPGTTGTGTSRTASPAAGADRAALRAMREKQKATEQVRRMENVLVREKLTAEKAVARAQQRTFTDAQRAIDRQVRSQTSLARQRVREERAVAREKERTVTARADFARSTIGGGASRVVSGLASVGQAGAGMLGIGGAALAASAVNEAVKLDEMTRRFSIAGRAAGETGVDPAAVAREVTGIGVATGIAPQRIMAGVQKFQADTGDSKTALGMGRTIATFAQATDAAPEEVASAAASLFSNFDIKTIDGLNVALARLTAQGKLGSFEFKGLASQLSRVTSSFAGRGVGAEALPEIGAIAQVVKKGTGSDEVTTTAIDAMFRQMISKSGDLQSGEAFSGRKVSVFKNDDATQGMRSDIGNLIAETMTASQGNVGHLQKIFGDEGMKGVGLFSSAYQKASNEAGGGDKGADAGRAAVLSMISEYSTAPGDMGEIKRDAFDAMQATSVQLDIAFTQLKDSVATALMPELIRLAPRLAELVPAVGAITESLVRVLSFLANNPFAGLGMLVSGAIVLELGKAGIGLAVSSALTAIMTRGGVMGIGATVPGVAGLGTLKGGLATAGAAIGVGLAIDQAATFGEQNGGFEGFKGMLGIGTKGWGFDGINEVLDARAKAEAAARERTAAATPPGVPATGAVPLDAADANAQLQLMVTSLAAANAELAKVRAAGINVGDKPTGVK